MSFGNKLKYYAKQYFGSIKKFAEALEIPETSLHRYINGSVEPGRSFFQKLQDLGCDINWLLSDDENPPPETDALLKKRIEELEEENQRLRDSISRLVLLAQEVEKETKGKRRKRK